MFAALRANNLQFVFKLWQIVVIRVIIIIKWRAAVDVVSYPVPSPLPQQNDDDDDDDLYFVMSLHTGRGIGGGLSSLAAHHFGVIRVFVGAALVSLFTAACWFLWIHLKPPDKTGFLCNTKNAQPNKRQLPTTTTSSRQQPKKNSGTAATVSQPITAGINNLKQKQQQSIIDSIIALVYLISSRPISFACFQSTEATATAAACDESQTGWGIDWMNKFHTLRQLTALRADRQIQTKLHIFIIHQRYSLKH